MANQPQNQSSSILLIDHPSRDPPSTRIRWMQLDGKITKTTFDTTEVPKFHKYSLQNSCTNLLCFAKVGARTNEEEESAPCALDIVANKVITLPKLPNTSDRRTSFYGVGYDSNIKKHKIVRIIVIFQNSVHNYVYDVEVYTLGESSWRIAKDRNKPLGSILGRPILIHGALVWADFPQTDVTYCSQHYANVFKIDEEKFEKVKLPSGLRRGHLVGIYGQLCAVDLSSCSSIVILVLKDLKEKWEILCTINMRATGGERDHRRTRVIGGLENDKLLIKSYESYFVYDIATEELVYLNLPVETGMDTEVHCYNGILSSFSSLKSEMGIHGWEWESELESSNLVLEKSVSSCALPGLEMNMDNDGWEWIEREEEEN